MQTLGLTENSGCRPGVGLRTIKQQKGHLAIIQNLSATQAYKSNINLQVANPQKETQARKTPAQGQGTREDASDSFFHELLILTFPFGSRF